MRIAILVLRFPPLRLGGTEIATYDIGKYLAARGNNVHIFTSQDKGLASESIEQQFFIHRFPLYKYKVRFVGSALFWMKMLLNLRKLNPDIIHCQSIIMGVPAFAANKIMKKPYVVWGQGSDVYLPWSFKSVISKLVLRNASAVIALTEDMQLKMQKFCTKKVMIIPNGVDSERFSSLSYKNSRKELGILENERIITFAGNLRPVKGVKYLIQAVSILNEDVSNVRLIIVGDGNDRKELEDLTKELNLKNKIIFAGKVSNEKVGIYMSASDIFVLPSLSEGLPNVILEAMNCGVPIIASRVGGVPSIVQDGQNGFLVEPKNPEQIADKVLLLLNNDNLRMKISENNLLKSKYYSWEGIITKLELVFEKFASSQRK